MEYEESDACAALVTPEVAAEVSLLTLAVEGLESL